MPETLSSLFTTPQDIFDMIGTAAAQLRLDDMKVASGETVTTTADAASGATTISVSALQYGLLQGTVLVFQLAGMDPPVQAILTTSAAIAATSITVIPLGSAITSGAQARDNGTNVWLNGLMPKACKYATARVMSYASQRYNTSDLTKSWTVNQWATVVACRWLAKRLFQVAPAGIESDYEEAMEELKAVKGGQLNIDDVPTRTASWPSFSNVTLDDRFNIRKVRVEPVISDNIPTQYAQSVDWFSLWGYYEW
jgi:hypothetical protein